MIIIPIIIGFGLAATGVSQATNEEWTHFKTTHGKSYNSVEEEEYRRVVFEDNMRFISQHNTRYQEGLETYDVGVNEICRYGKCLLTNEEFIELMTGYIPEEEEEEDETDEVPIFDKVSGDIVVNGIDYRSLGAITPVRNQGRCGSCYAFAAIAALESHHFLKTGELVYLSEQNAMDCMKNMTLMGAGCGGGNHNKVFTYIDENDGIDTRDFYPYEAQDGECRFDPAYVGAEDYGYVKVDENEDAMKVAVTEEGPLAVAIHAEGPGFQHYSTGVYYNETCPKHKGNHAVAVVGYGWAKTGGNYWLVKNSWGVGWGKDGYIKMARDKNNHCGIADRAIYPIV
ncbi:digestive cysteine proteinase 1-like [Palaemon carinicauda]|uniref:digestive cysteine proteinase 1-like n=1 Tax=Palaemon carinicauda TaxID=392227 RepID=UPI0035B6AA16